MLLCLVLVDLSKRNKCFKPQPQIKTALNNSICDEEDNEIESGDEFEEDNLEPVTPDDLFASNQATVSKETMQGYKSALLWLYEEKHKIETSAKTTKWLSSFVKGYKRIVAQKKQDGIMDVNEGTKPLSFSGHSSLALLLMKLQPTKKRYNIKRSLFGWPFQNTIWNLIARGGNVGKILLTHMDWSEDCMLINIPSHKGDEAGEGQGQQKHCYANPIKPEICIILSIAVMVFCKHRAKNDKFDSHLFSKDNVNHFGNLLRDILLDEHLLPSTVDLGAARELIGPHSNRKGPSTYLLTLSNCLNAANIYLRAGWSIGNVQDRYIFSDVGGDQIVGRAVAGLPVNSQDFTVLPPHFTDLGLQRVLEIGWENLLEGFYDYPEAFRRVVPFFLASIVYHQDFLRQNLAKSHPLFDQRIFTQFVKLKDSTFQCACTALKEFVVTGHDECKFTGMRATGIPSHLIVAKQVHTLSERITHLENALLTQQNNCLLQLLNEIKAVPSQLCQLLLERFQVDGVAPLTRADMLEFAQQNNCLLMEKMTELLKQFHVQQVAVPASDEEPEQTLSVVNGTQNFRYFSWGGSLGRIVPVDFSFPSAPVKTIWDLWHFGKTSEGIRPYKLLADFHSDLRTKRDKELFSRAKKIMDMLDTEVHKHNYLPDGVADISELDLGTADTVFEKAFQGVFQHIAHGKKNKRPYEMNLNTLCNAVYKKAKNPTQPAPSEIYNCDHTNVTTNALDGLQGADILLEI